ncbi:hypothetical protein GCM10010232_27280 [Streptomyces amakusaensis]|uniref:Restriction endonuclease subunit S n=1 Tax=Streptomyces amakusaensis TaxID=67271 RepID=A0ABW0AJE2_9ACTN
MPGHDSTNARLIPLGRICEVTAGPSGSLLDSLHEGPEGVPVVSPPDITAQGRIGVRKLRRVPWETTERLARFALREGDVLLVRQGALGRLALVEAEHTGWFYNSSCLRIRPRPEIVLPAYLAAWLSFPEAQGALLGQALPGTVPSVNSTILRELQVTVPPMPVQYDTVATLADMDDQIRIHRRSADRLEALRPAVFNELIEGS